jgi:hypothetical protein
MSRRNKRKKPVLGPRAGLSRAWPEGKPSTPLLILVLLAMQARWTQPSGFSFISCELRTSYSWQGAGKTVNEKELKFWN